MWRLLLGGAPSKDISSSKIELFKSLLSLRCAKCLTFIFSASNLVSIDNRYAARELSTVQEFARDQAGWL
jgi:hypothetical protein